MGEIIQVVQTELYNKELINLKTRRIVSRLTAERQAPLGSPHCLIRN
jgi:hypothetical protein